MSLPFILILVGFAYVVIFGGMALLRREGLSLRLAIESIIITGLTLLLVYMGVNVHPVLFLLVVYLITMRVRLIVELATILAKRENFKTSEQLFNLALRLWPDQTGKFIVYVNQGTALLQQGNLDEASKIFKEIIDDSSSGYLGRKYEAAALYNLGVVYLRKNQPGEAKAEFNKAIETMPASEYAKQAAQALDRLHKNTHSNSSQP